MMTPEMKQKIDAVLDRKEFPELTIEMDGYEQ